jgi:hypothetical protein
MIAGCIAAADGVIDTVSVPPAPPEPVNVPPYVVGVELLNDELLLELHPTAIAARTTRAPTTAITPYGDVTLFLCFMATSTATMQPGAFRWSIRRMHRVRVKRFPPVSDAA